MSRWDEGPDDADTDDSENPDRSDTDSRDDDSADLEACIHCGNPIYDLADRCPHCGMNESPHRPRLAGWIIIGVIVCIVLTLWMMR